MSNIKFYIITPNDKEIIDLIAEWYLSEWNIPIQTTIEKTKKLSINNCEFQVLMTVDSEPIATGGIYNHVGLLDKEPRLKIYKNWLALVYTKPNQRGKGYGALICEHIQAHSKQLGLNEIYLFTHTAKNLYKRLDWHQIERIALGGKNIVVMKKELYKNKIKMYNKIRAVKPTDIDGLKKVVDSSELFPSEYLEEMTSDYFNNIETQDIWFAYFDNNKPVAIGYCVAEKLTKGTYNLLAIGVSKDYQQKGIANEMMKYIEQLLKDKDGRILIVETSSDDAQIAARKFYQKIGYTQEGVIRDFWKDGEDKIVFLKKL